MISTDDNDVMNVTIVCYKTRLFLLRYFSKLHIMNFWILQL